MPPKSAAAAVATAVSSSSSPPALLPAAVTATATATATPATEINEANGEAPVKRKSLGGVVGRKKFSILELTTLINLYRQLHPKGTPGWQRLADAFNNVAKAHSLPIRDTGSLKKRFDKMVSQPVPNTFGKNAAADNELTKKKRDLLTVVAQAQRVHREVQEARANGVELEDLPDIEVDPLLASSVAAAAPRPRKAARPAPQAFVMGNLPVEAITKKRKVSGEPIAPSVHVFDPPYDFQLNPTDSRETVFINLIGLMEQKELAAREGERRRDERRAAEDMEYRKSRELWYSELVMTLAKSLGVNQAVIDLAKLKKND